MRRFGAMLFVVAAFGAALIVLLIIGLWMGGGQNSPDGGPAPGHTDGAARSGASSSTL